jgi:23S rRNA (uracil1939-C5)-methyltransferase
MVQKGNEVDLKVVNLAYGGKGVARQDGLVVFVEGAVPGDEVRARVVRRKRDYAEARLEEVLAPSPHRVEPRCELFGECGGCAAQNVAYDEQLRQKEEQVRQVLTRIGRQGDIAVEPIRPSPAVWRYRNKMDFTFGSDREGQIVLGMHRRGKYASIVNVERCWLQPERFDRALGAVRRFARQSGLPAYDPRTHKGFWRHLVLRHSVAEDRVVAVVITASGTLPDFEGLVGELREADTNLAGLVWAVNDSVADVAACQERRAVWGDEVLCEQLGDMRFRVSPLSFFQVNTRATEELYATIADDLRPDDALTLLDAYCGTGSIGIYCARRFARVVGIESVREAVWDARANARLNGLDNCTFLCGRVKKSLALARSVAGGRLGRLVVDPPRGGMDKRALAGLLDLRAPVLVYVSCNPATLARDVVAMCNAGYVIERVQPFDLFPHTPHIETVVQFRLRDGKNGQPTS